VWETAVERQASDIHEYIRAEKNTGKNLTSTAIYFGEIFIAGFLSGPKRKKKKKKKK